MSKLPRVSLFQILSDVWPAIFELAYSWKSYRTNKKSELFETQAKLVIIELFRHVYGKALRADID